MKVSRLTLLPLLCRPQNLERAHEAFVNAHHGASIIEFAAVVWCREERDQASAGEKFVAVFHDLVGTANKVEVMLHEEVLDNCASERKRHSAVVGAPHGLLSVGVGPEQVAEQARLRHIPRPHQAANLVHVIKFWRKPAVHAENLFVDDSSDRHAVEALRKSAPQRDGVPPLALVVEPIYSVDGGALVVAPKQKEVLRVLDFVGEQEADGFQTLASAVHVVAQEEVIGLRREPAVLEKAEQVVVLAVDIATDFDGGFQLDEDGLRHEHVFGLHAQFFDVGLWEVHLLTRVRAAHREQLLDDFIHIEVGR